MASDAQPTTPAATAAETPTPAPAPPPSNWTTGKLPIVIFFVALIAFAVLIAAGLQYAVKQFGTSALSNKDFWKALTTPARSSAGQSATPRAVDPSLQAEAESLLERLAAGDASAAEKILTTSDNWTGKTQRSQKADQMMIAALKSSDLRIRAAAVQAELALGRISRDEKGLDYLERTARNPHFRSWALWMLGAIGNRGVNPARAGNAIKAYLDDPDAKTRAAAVEGLAVLGTDDTLPLLLDCFRHDSSPVVQEGAARNLAESGMYTHAQRMAAAATLVTWLDDSSLSPAQREWTLHALRDISGQNLGTDSMAWRRWYESTQ